MNMFPTPEEFNDLVERIGFSPVPERFRSLISNVAITVEDEPSAADRAIVGLSPDETLLGLYVGIPRTARGEGYALALPDRIVIYRLPTIEAARDDKLSLEEVVRETIWHEVAHHFGLDEDEVGRRESERTGKRRSKD